MITGRHIAEADLEVAAWCEELLARALAGEPIFCETLEELQLAA